MSEILQTETLRKQIMEDFNELANANNLNGLEKIKNFYLTD